MSLLLTLGVVFIDSRVEARPHGVVLRCRTHLALLGVSHGIGRSPGGCALLIHVGRGSTGEEEESEK